MKIMSNISRLGIGLYNGDETDAIDAQLLDVMRFAISQGITVFDCAPSYRNFRSEKLLGELLREFPDHDFFISTKGGFVPFDFTKDKKTEDEFVQDLFEKGLIRPDLFDQDSFQTFDTNYLDFLFKNTLFNLNRPYSDVYYLHNPEYFLNRVERSVFLNVMRDVFFWLKELIAIGQIKSFGISSWTGFFNDTSKNTLQLMEFVDLSEEAGIRDYFQFVQIPYNLAQTKALFSKSQIFLGEPFSLIRLAQKLGLTVISSAPMGQGKLLNYGLSEKIKRTFNGMSNPQVSLSFVLSSPGISSTLIGTKSILHLKELTSVYLDQQYGDNHFLETLAL
jgi:aryl-alcohol dehydrogenase-like predicted oxidoreductase